MCKVYIYIDVWQGQLPKPSCDEGFSAHYSGVLAVLPRVLASKGLTLTVTKKKHRNSLAEDTVDGRNPAPVGNYW